MAIGHVQEYGTCRLWGRLSDLHKLATINGGPGCLPWHTNERNKMRIGTVQLPSEWQTHAHKMKEFIDNYAYHAAQYFKVSIVGAGQNHRVEVADYGNLSEIEKAALDTAVSTLNECIT